MLDAGRSWDDVARRLGTTVAEVKALVDPARTLRRHQAARAKAEAPAQESTEVFAGIDKILYNAGPGSLAAPYPQVSTRARLYKLQDDGAARAAQRRRDARNRHGTDPVAEHRADIERILARQAGTTKLAPLSEASACGSLGCTNAIRRHQSAFDATAPAVNLIAPVARRVAREDRRRKAAEQRKSHNDGQH